MKKTLFIIAIILILAAPSILFAWLVYPDAVNSEDMFLGLAGVFYISAILYFPILVLQLTMVALTIRLKNRDFAKEKSSMRLWLHVMFLLLAGLALTGYCVYLCTWIR